MNFIPVNQPDYQTGYSNIGKQVGGAIEAVPQAMEQQRQIKLMEEKMRDLKQFKTTMSNVANFIMGNDFSQEEKASVQSEIQNSKDPNEIASKLAELKLQQDIYKNARQQYPNAVLPKPTYGVKSDTYSKMVDPVIAVEKQKEESKKIGETISQPAQPVQQAPVSGEVPGGNQDQFYSDEQIKNEMQGNTGIQQIPQPPQPKTQAQVAAELANAGVDIGGGQAKAALSAMPTDYQIMQDRTKQAGAEATADYRKAQREDKAKAFAETQAWHRTLAEIMRARNAIAKGEKNTNQMISTEKVILAQKAANAKLDTEIRNANKNIRDLEKKKRGLQEEIKSAEMLGNNDTLVEQLNQDISNIDLNILTLNNDIGDFEDQKAEIQEGMDIWTNEVMPTVSKKQGYNYPKPGKKPKTEPASIPGASLTTPKGNKVTVRIK